jgi:hypothetical protein
MRSISRGVRVFSLSLGLMLAACGGSSSTKDGGHDAAAGSDGAAGSDAGNVGVAGNDGAAGGDAAVGSDGAAGNDGAAGQSGHDGGAAGADAGHADGATEAGIEGGVTTTDGGDASMPDGAVDVSGDGSPPPNPCAPNNPIAAPVIAPTIINNGAAPYVAGFLGGALASGTYYLTNVVHFGATYTGPTQEELVVDATAHTLGDSFVVGTTRTDLAYATTFPSSTIIAGAPLCGGATATMWNYLVTGTGAGSTLSLNAVGSSDVEVFTKQ